MKYPYYLIMLREFSKKAGLLYRPNEPKWSIIETPGESMPDIDGLVYELKDGPYADYMLGLGGATVVSERMKELMEKYGALEDGVEFYPVKNVSKEYVDRVAYILHFSKVSVGAYRTLAEYMEIPPTPYDAPMDFTPYWMRSALDYSKVAGLSVLTTQYVGSHVIVSDELRKAINRSKMNAAIEFCPLECANVPEELIRKGYHSVNAPDPADRGDDLSRFPHLRIKSDLFNN